jgi:hypothetical protein
MTTITLSAIKERKKLSYIEWLRKEAEELRASGDSICWNLANEREQEAECLERGWPFVPSAEAA